MIVFGAKQHLSFCIYSLILFKIRNILYLELSENDYIFVLAALIGCLLPDIDHHNAIAGYIIPAHKFLRHGTITHTLLFSSIFIFVFALTDNIIWLGIWFGYFTHLFSDNIQGNNLKYLYYPFTRKRR